MQDPTGDSRINGPSYADVVAVTIEDDSRSARVTVSMAAAIPTALPDGESMGVGVDFFRQSDAKESDYQLFAEGSADGWFAYLQGTSGFVDFPGSFRLGSDLMVFEVPWSSLGGVRAASFSCFSDWSDSSKVVAQSAEDLAPDAGRGRFSR